MKSIRMWIVSLVLVAALVAQAAAEQSTMSLVTAREQIAEAISNPSTMTAIMKKLSSADQKQFVADVNAAIASMPGSAEELAAMYLNAGRAALSGASKGNLATIVAEIYATASVESLSVINETFATEVFNRAANPSVTYTDDEFKQITSSLMATVNERVAKADNGDVRSGFAGLMMIRASNSSSPEMTAAVVAMLPASAQALAKNEWYPAALAEGEGKSYDPMLGMADSAENLKPGVVITVAGPQDRDAMLSDLAGTSLDVLERPGTQMPVWDAVQHQANVILPQPTTAGMADNGKVRMAASQEKLNEYIASEEPRGYPWQKR